VSDIERMTIAVPAPMANKIKAAVASGDYASTSEVVRDAMRFWSERREERDALRAAWDAGKASGQAGALDMGALIAEARSEAEAPRKNA
jgi:antitoxin ParD1/3/4